MSSLRCEAPSCSAKFDTEDGHSLCCAHAPCTSSKAFNPAACPTCNAALVRLREADSLNVESDDYLLLKHRWSTARKWSSKSGSHMSWQDKEVKEFLNFSRDSSRSRSSSRASSTSETRSRSVEEIPSSSRTSKRHRSPSHVERALSKEPSEKRSRRSSPERSITHLDLLNSPQFSSLLSTMLDEKLGALKEALSTPSTPGLVTCDQDTMPQTQEVQLNEGPASDVSNNDAEAELMDVPLLHEVCAEVNKTLEWSRLPEGCQVLDKEGQFALYVWARREGEPPEWHHLPLVSIQWREDPLVTEDGAFFFRAKSLAQMRSASSQSPLTPAKFQEAMFSIRRLIDGSITPETVFQHPNASGRERSTVIIPMSVTSLYEPYWNNSTRLWECAATSADYVSQTTGADPSTSIPVHVADPQDTLAPLLQFLQAPPLSLDPLLPGLKPPSKSSVTKDSRSRKTAETLLSGSFLGLFLANLTRQAAATTEELSPQQMALFLTELATVLEAQALSSRGVARDMLEKAVIARMNARREAATSVSASTKANLLHSSPFSPSLFDKEEARQILQAAAPRVEIKWPKHLGQFPQFSPTQRGRGRGFGSKTPAKALSRAPPRSSWRPKSSKPREGPSQPPRKGFSQATTKRATTFQQTGRKEVSDSSFVTNGKSLPQLRQGF